MKTLYAAALAAVALAIPLTAVETRFWQQTDQADFEKGSLDRLSLRSDGRIFLAPAAQELFDSSTPYLWAIALDGPGNVYTAGGGTGTGSAKLLVTGADGKTRTLAELEGLEIHALAVDRAGTVYAATDPDGKVYKIARGAKPQVWYDPHAKYIWALALDSKGSLYVATGDKGEVHRVTAAGQGAVFFKTEETHARSLTVDASDNVIVGTEPGGLVIRISPSGSGFVLYQSPKREMTAVAVGPGGDIYAAGVGTRATQPAPAQVSPPPQPAQLPAATAQAAPAQGTISVVTGRPVAQLPPSFAASAVSGGSDVYRIDRDGSPRRVWTNSVDVVYAIGFDGAGRPVLGSGNRGRIYRLDSAVLSTLLLELPPTQITGFAAGAGGRLYAVTGNIGKIYRIGPGLASRGVFESDVLDAGAFSYWGRMEFRGKPANAAVYTRTGNLSRPQDNWSEWKALEREPDAGVPPCSRCLSGRVGSPPARFLQYKVELSERGTAQQAAPEVASVEVAYLSKNFAPAIEELEIGPPNYRFPPPAAPPASGTSAPATVLLPPLGQKRRNTGTAAAEAGSSQSVTYAKGFMGARWNASDENGDVLTYTVEIRGVGEKGWNLLKDKLREKYYSWDSTAFPDGEYEVRVTASDAPSNPPGQALTATIVSDPFLIDNTPPEIEHLAARPSGDTMSVEWRAHDARSIIAKAEYAVNGGDWVLIEPTTKLSDAPEEDYRLTIGRSGGGEQTIAVRVTDSYDNQAVGKVVVR